MLHGFIFTAAVSMTNRLGFSSRLVVAGAVVFATGCSRSRSERIDLGVARPRADAPGPSMPDESLRRSAEAEPLEFLRSCLARYDHCVRGYTCRFVKKERIQGTWTAEQEMDVAFSERPFTVDMRWIRGAGRARRVVYIEGRWERNGKKMARVELAGLPSILPVYLDIYDSEMSAESRGAVDQFGFRQSLKRTIDLCERARDDPRYELRFLGEETIDGRRCFLLERRLPFSGECGAYPDRLMRMYVDQESGVPLATLSFADDEGKVLLGMYRFHDVVFHSEPFTAGEP